MGSGSGIAPPEQTASEMERLVAMHLQHVDKSVPPEVEAGWIHHRFTQIHPFQDGNGRVARALATLVLLRAGLFPVVVPLDEKDAYQDHLERADAGNLQPLVYYVALRQQEAHRLARKACRRGKTRTLHNLKQDERSGDLKRRSHAHR